MSKTIAFHERLLFRCLNIAIFAVLVTILFSLASPTWYGETSQANKQPDDASSLNSAAADPSAKLNSSDLSEDRLAAPLRASNVESLPSSSSEGPQMHIVIAHYSEDPSGIEAWTNNIRMMPFMQELGVKVFIYTKQSGDDVDLAKLGEKSGAQEVVQLPNTGREGGTYLHHILRVHHDPPKHILFAQASLQPGQQDSGEQEGQLDDWLEDRLRNKFDGEIGFMSLAKGVDACNCGHCFDMGRDDYYPLWSQIYTMLNNELCHEVDQLVSFRGQFIVSRKRILARPLLVYKYLHELVDAPEDHWIHSEIEPRWFDDFLGSSNPSNPKFGHTLERLWHAVFSCSDSSDGAHCEVENPEEGEGRGGCWCKDNL